MTLHNRINELLKEKEFVVIAIDGPSGSGKSTFGRKLQEEYDASLFHMDDFFLPSDLKTEERLNQIGGNVYIERMIEEVFRNLGNDIITYRKFNCMDESYSNPIEESVKRVIIIEGCYSLHPLVQKYYDIKVHLYVDEMTQEERILERNGERMLQRFLNEWIPLENKYFEGIHISKIADFNINNS